MARLDKEVKTIKACFEGSKTIEKLRFDEDERNLYFTFCAGKRKIRFQFYVPYGYPADPSPDERPLLMQEEGLHDEIVEQVNDFSRDGGSLPQSVELLHKLVTKQLNLKASRDISLLSEGKAKEEHMEEEEASASESEEEYYEDEEEMSSGNQTLRKDVEETESYFGKGSVKYFPELSMVRLFIDTTFLSESVASALGIDCTIPVNISLHFGEEYLASPTPPTFEVDQKPKAEQFGLQFQITEIIRNWIKQNWRKGEYSTSLTTSSGGTTSSFKPLGASSSGSSSSGGLLGKFFNKKGQKGASSSSSSSSSSTPSPMESDELYEPDKKYPSQLKELLDMGFERDIAMYALQTTHGVVAEALNLCLDPQPWFKEEAKKLAKNKGAPVTRALTKSQASRSKYNFLISLAIYVRSRLSNCSNYCPICDHKHECEGLKPIVCSKPDCIWRYEELGLGANVNAEIARAPEVVDLMISLACAAINSGRADTIFDPFPTADFMNRGGSKDFNLLKTVLEGLPSVTELSSAPEIRPFLDLLDPGAPNEKTYYRLVRWLLTSNRAHLVRLTEEQQIKEMSTPYQYMLLTSTPEKEARFAALKKKHGSFLAFHGSPMENWHSILRNGLRNMSNTKNMLHGAAHGAGIYLAPNAGTSQGYMRSGTGWAKSQFGASLSCLAMCEVIDHPDVYGRDHNQWCYVAKEDDHVMTRFFFIYSSTSSFPSSVNARQLKVPDMQTFKP